VRTAAAYTVGHEDEPHPRAKVQTVAGCGAITLQLTVFKKGQLLVASNVQRYSNFESNAPLFMSIIKISNGMSDGMGHSFVPSIADTPLAAWSDLWFSTNLHAPIWESSPTASTTVFLPPVSRYTVLVYSSSHGSGEFVRWRPP